MKNAQNPNENLSREFFELFSLEGYYSEADIKNFKDTYQEIQSILLKNLKISKQTVIT